MVQCYLVSICKIILYDIFVIKLIIIEYTIHTCYNNECLQNSVRTHPDDVLDLEYNLHQLQHLV